jgi:hypothetical protein
MPENVEKPYRNSRVCRVSSDWHLHRLLRLSRARRGEHSSQASDEGATVHHV